MIAYTIDTSDAEKEKDHLRFSTEILPKAEERSVDLARRLVASGMPRRSSPRRSSIFARPSRFSARPTSRSSRSWRS